MFKYFKAPYVTCLGNGHSHHAALSPTHLLKISINLSESFFIRFPVDYILSNDIYEYYETYLNAKVLVVREFLMPRVGS
ncbi:MAG: hypothetical protein QXK73_05020 [Candidatus Bathyarchaeia archaeon]